MIDLWKPITDAQRNGNFHLVRGPRLRPTFAMCDQRPNGGVRVWNAEDGARYYDDTVTQFLDVPDLNEFAPR